MPPGSHREADPTVRTSHVSSMEKGKEMKALSLRQPWPWFILKGGKDLENRGWTSSYRGPVLIHSSK